MRLLVCTQAVDTENPVLGFFHAWLVELAKHVERIEVICLYEGAHELPSNVTVHSLGKERGRAGRVRYASRFLKLAWRLRGAYDAAFVHMNQEYILLAGPLWKLLGKRVYMWRNHYTGSWLTNLAAVFCTAVFCTSRQSYTARYRKTRLMPVGVDTDRFRPDPRMPRVPGSILFLARMDPSKDPLMLLHALRELREKGIACRATFVGSPSPGNEAYYRSLVGRAEPYGLADRVSFLPAVAHAETPDLYRTHEVFVNCSPSGMLDKTLFEAAASGCFVLAASHDWRVLAGETGFFDSPTTLAGALSRFLASASEADGRVSFTNTNRPNSEHMRDIVEKHDLSSLAARLMEEMRP